MHYILYLFLGLLPSLLWLFYFFRKDIHPESKKQIARIFLWGAALTLPALIVEIGVKKGLGYFSDFPVAAIIFDIFLGIAFVEEYFKYLAVRWKVMSSPVFDEPIDAMIYMITAALGFAAVENILLFFTPNTFSDPIISPWLLALVRFLGATLLHALVSAIVGFSIALNFLRHKSYLKFPVIGLAAATLLHGLYDLIIIRMSVSLVKLYLIIALLSALAFFVGWSFKKIKRLSQ